MGKLKTMTGIQFFEDYLLPTNGQTKNKLWELTLLPFGARNTAWLSLKCGKEQMGIINACRMRIASALSKGGAHAIGTAQCAVIAGVLANSGDTELLAYAGFGAIYNAYCTAVQGDVAMRCARVLQHAHKKNAKNDQE